MQAAPRPATATVRWARGLAGLTLLVVGGAMLGWMLVALFAGDPTQSRTLLHLGLALTAIGSAAGQILVLVGGWLIWRALEDR